MKGGVVIFAAGNDGLDYRSFPGAYPPVVAVGSMAPDWKSAYYSNRGDWVDITAPGGDAHYPQGEVLSTLSKKITGKDYGYMQGTSMACPHVSGIAALIVSHFGRQGFTNVECQQRLLGALKAQNIDALTGYPGRMGRGYIDASAVFAENRARLLLRSLRSMSTKSPSSRPTSLGLLSATKMMVRLSNTTSTSPKRKSPMLTLRMSTMPRSMLRAMLLARRCSSR